MKRNARLQWNPDTTILDITINMVCPDKSYSKMYGTEPRYNDEFLALATERKIFPDITTLHYQQ